jgi:hypothetical protein
MPKKMLTYGAGLIATFLVVRNASGSGKIISSGAAGISTVTKTFQGR